MTESTPKKKLFVGVVVGAAVLGGMALIWPRLQSDAPEPAASNAAAGHAEHRNSDVPVASYAFDETPFAAIRAAMEGADQIGGLLARDTTEGLAGQATAVKVALETARGAANSIPESILQTIKAAEGAAATLSEQKSIEQARARLGTLNQGLVRLAQTDARLTEGWHIFTCPMTEGFSKWFQRTPRQENPYMGQRMLTCGTTTDWGLSNEIASNEHQHDAEGGEIAYYTCPMHPSVKQQEDGVCPICGMDLTPVTKKEAETGTIVVDDVRRQRIGVRTEKVEERDMSLTVRAVGKVKYDETRLADVNLRISGWVQTLLVDETGAKVRKGQRLFTLYSPELYAAQLEYLAAVRNSKEAKSLSAFAGTAKDRLRLLGMSPGQIRSLGERGEAWEHVPILAPASGYVVEKNVVAGAQVEAGTRVYRIANLDKVWVDADVYESDLPNVKVGQPVQITLPYLADKKLSGVVDYVYPTLQAATRTGRVRIVLGNADLQLKPDMYANVEFKVDVGRALAIPASAVVYTGPRRLVFVDLGEGRLRPVEVELGTYADGYYEVTSGLKVGETVVTSGNFLIAAESRIRSASKYWGGRDDGK